MIDESAFTKKGSHSAGVARQHNGRLGKEDNCQVGVFLVGVTPAGSALLDHRLFLPESWCEPTREAKDRREAAHIPEDVTFRTKPQIAAELIRERRGARPGRAGLGGRRLGVRPGGPLPRRAGAAGAAVRARGAGDDGVFWTADPAGCVPAYSGRGRKPTAPTRDAVRTGGRDRRRAARLGVDRRCRCARGRRGRWCSSSRRSGSGAIRHRKPGPPSWLLIRRSLGAEPELKYYVSNADAETPLSTLALVACTRCRVEEFLEDCKSYLGMAQYETRSWVGWHHHMTLVGLAHLFVTLVRRRLQKKRRS